MSTRWLKALVVIIGCTVLIGCAAQKPTTTFQPYDFGPGLKSGKYFQEVDNFLVILDASASMSQRYKGRYKLDTAKDIIDHMNRTMSPLKLNGALRTFGGRISVYKKITSLIYGLTEYNATEFGAALQTVKRAGGDSPLTSAVDTADEDLKTAQGKIAVIAVSDGLEMDDSPVASARRYKDQFGERLCIYTVLVGQDARGKNLLEQISQAGQCGFSVSADDIAAGENMADFVKKVFFGEKPFVDSDGDGLNDDLDQCPDTPVGVMVDARGCALDSDGDGVSDHFDQCPGTPRGVTVGKWGCRADSDRDGVFDDDDMCPDTPYGAQVNEKGCWVLKGLLFDSTKWDIKPEMYPALDEVAAVFQSHPSLRIEIQGHTDSMGDAAYNKMLSENRAKAVREYLVDKGVDWKKISAAGFGEARPIANNDSPEGRAMNRRVELKPLY